METLEILTRFFYVSGIIGWCSVVLCVLIIIGGLRNAETAPDESAYIREAKSRHRALKRPEKLTLEQYLDGIKQAAEKEWHE